MENVNMLKRQILLLRWTWSFYLLCIPPMKRGEVATKGTHQTTHTSYPVISRPVTALWILGHESWITMDAMSKWILGHCGYWVTMDTWSRWMLGQCNAKLKLLEPLSTCNWIGAIRKLAYPNFGACFCPFLSTFGGFFLNMSVYVGPPLGVHVLNMTKKWFWAWEKGWFLMAPA